MDRPDLTGVIAGLVLLDISYNGITDAGAELLSTQLAQCVWLKG